MSNLDIEVGILIALTGVVVFLGCTLSNYLSCRAERKATFEECAKVVEKSFYQFHSPMEPGPDRWEYTADLAKELRKLIEFRK